MLPDKIYSALGITAAILSMVAFVPYISSILENKTSPSGASWWTWSLITTITVISSYFAGAPWQILILPLWLCVSQLAVAILSLQKGDRNWDSLNKFCAGGALAGILFWVITGEPLLALVCSIAADFFASVPNFRHVYSNPEQENRLGWTLGFASALLEIFAIKAWSLASAGWAIYFFINMGIVFLLVWRPTIKSLRN